MQIFSLNKEIIDKYFFKCLKNWTFFCKKQKKVAKVFLRNDVTADYKNWKPLNCLYLIRNTTKLSIENLLFVTAETTSAVEEEEENATEMFSINR